MITFFIFIFISIIISLILSFKKLSFLLILIPSIFGIVFGIIKGQQIQRNEALSGHPTMASGFTTAGSIISGFFFGLIAFTIYKIYKSNLNTTLKYIIAIPLSFIATFLLHALIMLIVYS